MIKRITILGWFLIFSLTGTVFSEDNLSKYLLEKKAAIEKKELQLKYKEEGLKELQLDLEKKIKKYNDLIASLEKIIKELKEIKSERFLHIVKTYEKMPPDEAAAQFEQLNEDLAVKILSKMKERKAAALLSRMSPDKAAKLVQKVPSIKGLDRLIKKFKKR